MSKKIGVILSLVLAFVFTFAIWHSANQRYHEAARTTEVLQTVTYIPAGRTINESDIEIIKVPTEIAKQLIQDKDEVVGKPAQVSLIQGQFIQKGHIGQGVGRNSNFNEVYIPTDLDSSAFAIAGERVNVHLVSKERTVQASTVLLRNARVTHCLDQNGNEITPEQKESVTDMAGLGNRIPVSIAIEVPPEKEQIIVQAASQNQLYLTKTNS